MKSKNSLFAPLADYKHRFLNWLFKDLYRDLDLRLVTLEKYILVSSERNESEHEGISKAFVVVAERLGAIEKAQAQPSPEAIEAAIDSAVPPVVRKRSKRIKR